MVSIKHPLAARCALSHPELSDKERSRSAFWLRQGLNALAPNNFFLTNPVAQRKAQESGGKV